MNSTVVSIFDFLIVYTQTRSENIAEIDMTIIVSQFNWQSAKVKTVCVAFKCMQLNYLSGEEGYELWRTLWEIAMNFELGSINAMKKCFHFAWTEGHG